jgi:hypothetical protein
MSLRRRLDRHQKDPWNEPEIQMKGWLLSVIHRPEHQMAIVVERALEVDWRWKEGEAREEEALQRTAWVV